MARSSRYPTELRERAVRMVVEHRGDYASEYEAIRSVAAKLGIGSAETLRNWVRGRRWMPVSGRVPRVRSTQSSSG